MTPFSNIDGRLPKHALQCIGLLSEMIVWKSTQQGLSIWKGGGTLNFKWISRICLQLFLQSGQNSRNLFAFEKRVKSTQVDLQYTLYTLFTTQSKFLQQNVYGRTKVLQDLLGQQNIFQGFLGPEPRNLLKDFWALGPDNYKLWITHKKPTIWTEAYDQNQHCLKKSAFTILVYELIHFYR